MPSVSGIPRRRLALAFVLVVSPVGCGFEGNEAHGPVTETRANGIYNVPDESSFGPHLIKQYNDCRGRVQSAIWMCWTSTPKEIHQISCQVPDSSYVAVGGGAEVTNTNGNYPGAFLIDSHLVVPSFNPQWNRYRASSKSHINSNPHGLKVFVVGLKIQGVSRQQLIDNLQKHETIVGPSNAPETWPQIPTGRVLLSANTFLEWAPTDGIGQLLVGSWGDSPTGVWGVKTKALGQNFSAKLRGYAISMPNSIGGINIAPRYAQTNAHVGSGVSEPHLTVPRMALTNIGGWAYYAGAGRMLQAMAPTLDGNWTVYARSKDHVTPDSGGTYVEAMGVMETFGNQCVPPL